MTDYQFTPMTCYKHPGRETLLRCNKCDRPICSECSVLTPTGYRCKECIAGQQKVFETAGTWDIPMAVVIALILSAAGSFVASLLGFFAIFIGPIAGVLIAEAVRRAVKKRRSRALYTAAAWAALVGALPAVAVKVANLVFSLNFGTAGIVYQIFPIVWAVIYAGLVYTTVRYRLSGIQL